MHNSAPRWATPVHVHLQCGLERGFVCVHDALDFLEHEWPSRTGALYARAANLCRLALDGGLPADMAREAFIFACLEAGMPVAGERRSRRRHEHVGDTLAASLVAHHAAETRMAHALAHGG